MIEKGNGHEHGNGHPYRALLEDEELAEQFQALVAAAQAKGFSEDEIGYGLLSGTVDSLLANGEPECCVMQLLLDFTSSYFDYWHDRMGGEDEEGEAAEGEEDDDR
jgi:hypothetical protein